MEYIGKCGPHLFLHFFLNKLLSPAPAPAPTAEATGSSSALWSDEREVGTNILRKPSEADACGFLLPIVIHVAGYTGSKTSSETFVGSFSILIN